jgi:hypothetical protein
MNPARKLEQMLRQHNFKLVRHNRHRIYQNHEGKTFVTAMTPSDYRWALNAVTQLNRVISNPARPMVLAITDYEREVAVEKIAGQQKHQIGQSNGKSKHSKGTGFIYEDRKVLTEEDKLQRESQRKQAIENKQRRREKKLAQRAAAEEKRQREVDEFENKFGDFLCWLERNVNDGITAFYQFYQTCEATIANKDELRKAIVESAMQSARRALRNTPNISNLEMVLGNEARKRFSTAKNLNERAHAWALGSAAHGVSRFNNSLERES